MKILQATTAVGWSGGTEQCLLLSRYMNEAGVETHILANPGTELEERARSLGIKVVNFPNTRKFSLKEARKLAERIAGYDLINTHISKAHWFVWFASLFLKKRPGLVYTRRVPFRMSLLSLVTKYNFRTDGLIAVSPQIYNYLRGIPFLRKKVRYIPSGVELDRFNPETDSSIRKELKIPEGTLLLTNVANYSEVKGHHILLPAFKKLLEEGVNAYLLLAGRDTDAARAREEIRKSGLEGRVIGLGFRRDIPQILKATDIFVFPSLNEGIAGSLLQAMAMEKIVVASRVGGIKSYLKDGINGIAVEPGSVEALLTGIKRAIREIKNEKMKKEARRTAVEFDIKRIVEKTLEFYRELLDENPVSRI